MKGLFLVLTLVLFSLVGQSQVLIGYSEKEIREHFTADETIKVSKASDGNKILTILSPKTNHYVRMYYLTEADACYQYIIQPTDQKGLDAFIEYCNSTYQRTDKKDTWITRLGLYDVKVQLVWVPETRVNIFHFTVAGF